MMSPRGLCAQAVLVSILFALVLADDFEIHEADNSDWGLSLGDPRCPSKIRFNDDDLSMKAADIEINNQKCAGGTLLLVMDPDSGGSLLTEALRKNPDRDNSVEGVLTLGLTCGTGTAQFKMKKGTYFQFFSPDQDIMVNFATVLGKNAPLTLASTTNNGSTSDNYTFVEDNDYLIVGAECIYGRKSFFRAACFPASATVELEDGGHRRMDALEIGDRVRTGPSEFSPIFAFTHKNRDLESEFVHIETTGRQPRALSLSPGHYLYVNGELSPARVVRPGDEIYLANGAPARVGSVRLTREGGLYNPQTAHGDIVVDGILSSTYTTAVEPRLAHASLAPLRAAYLWFGFASRAFESGAGVFAPYLPSATNKLLQC